MKFWRMMQTFPRINKALTGLGISVQGRNTQQTDQGDSQPKNNRELLKAFLKNAHEYQRDTITWHYLLAEYILQLVNYKLKVPSRDDEQLHV
ncbi:expressed unknown protein [Seminavis robusta]|uniref:Uncharacterized protein n=1 Tax=Seminavis robusta TaxID=568900 RepID=A0A9N8DDX4_9STRA|nr:expressed unknown protein [Seminavis robusta]|eukprot:Sro97_g050160.1 n/a (92) ;mRNA; r:106199-106564